MQTQLSNQGPPNRSARRHPEVVQRVATLEPLLTTQELADYLGLPLGTVYRLNYAHTGPRPIRVGRHVRYRQRDVEAWLEEQAKSRRAS